MLTNFCGIESGQVFMCFVLFCFVLRFYMHTVGQQQLRLNNVTPHLHQEGVSWKDCLFRIKDHL